MKKKELREIIREHLTEELKTSTRTKLLNSAERDGHIEGMEKSAQYILAAAKEVADQFDKLTPEAQKVMRDKYYRLFLQKTF